MRGGRDGEASIRDGRGVRQERCVVFRGGFRTNEAFTGRATATCYSGGWVGGEEKWWFTVPSVRRGASFFKDTGRLVQASCPHRE